MTEFHGTWMQELIKNLILSFSALGLGTALYMVLYDVRRALRARGHERRLWFSRALFALSFIIVVGLLAEAIYKQKEPLPLEWRAVLYTMAIVCAAIGGLGMAYESQRADAEAKRKGRFL